MIEAEHDARLHRDAVVVKTADDLAVFGGAIVALVGNVKAGLRDGLEAEEQGFASASGREGHEFIVERHVGGALTLKTAVEADTSTYRAVFNPLVHRFGLGAAHPSAG